MKLIYKAIFILGSILYQAFSLPIIYEPNNNQKQIHTNILEPAIVVTQGKPMPTNQPILYEPAEIAKLANSFIVPPPPPPGEPGPIITDTNIINDIMPAKFVLPDGKIIYTPKDIKPFIV